MIWALAILILAALILLGFYYFQKLPQNELEERLKNNRMYAFDSVAAQWLTVDDLSIRYIKIIKDETKPNIVFIHGIASSMYCWRNMYEHFIDDYNVYALDLPGFGYSSKPEEISYDLDSQVKRVHAWAEQLGLKQFTVVGHSMGAVIAAWLAKKYPAQVTQLVLLAPGFSHKFKYVPLAMVLLLAKPLKHFIVTPRLVEWIHRRNFTHTKVLGLNDIALNAYLPYFQSPTSVITFLKSNMLLSDRRIKNEFFDFRMPILLISASRDRLVLGHSIKRFLKYNPKTQYIEMKNSGHLVIIEEGAQVAKFILIFLNKYLQRS